MGTTNFLRAGLAAATLALAGGTATAQTGAATDSGALGCQAIVSTVAETGRVTLGGVYFDFNQATLRPDSLSALLAARDAIRTLGGAWTIEGHTDTIGSHAYNQRLSLACAQAVADWLGSAGIAPAQLAAQGFSFDRPVADNATETGRAQNRRVELVALSPDFDAVGFGGPAGIEAEGCGEAVPSDVAAAPGVPDWSGAGGQEWLPFSQLMATAAGSGSGWVGERLELPVGTHAESCRALCLAEDRCGAFSFEPTGSYFVELPRCVLIGYGTEIDLQRRNGYQDDETFFASGLKPDARLLTPESEQVAAAILADMAEIERYRSQVRIEAPTDVASGEAFAFRVTGIVPAERHNSFIEIADLGDYSFHASSSKDHVFVDYFGPDGSGTLTAPEPGTYVLRYVVRHETFGTRTLAEQVLVVSRAETGAGAVEVRGGMITVGGPAQAQAGGTITVSWSEINDPGDWVTVVPAGSEEGGWLDYKYVGENFSDTLQMPDATGLYEVRYVRNADNATLGRYVIEAVAQRAALAPAAPEPTPAQQPYETAGMGEDTGYYCPADAMPCRFEDEATGIGFTLAPGFYTDFPYFYETAGGVAAEEPTLSLIA